MSEDTGGALERAIRTPVTRTCLQPRGSWACGRHLDHDGGHAYVIPIAESITEETP